MFIIKNSKPVEETERVRFRCTRCAECCRHVKGAVIIESLDAFRLAQHLKIEVSEFINRYTDPFILDEHTEYPIFALTTAGHDNSCVFLRGSRCTVQEAKPRTCRLYPFWVEPNDPDGATYTYHLSTERSHHPKGSIVRVKDWMKDYFLAEERAFLKEEYQAMREIAPLMHIARSCGIDKEELLKVILYYRYFAFELGKPFLPQQHRNDCELIAVLQRMIQSI